MTTDGTVAVSLLNCPTNTRPNRDFTACLASAGLFIGSSGVRFPPSPYMSGLTLTSGTETFTASASSFYAPTNEASWRAFSGASTSGVAGTNVNAWTANTGFYSGSGGGGYTSTTSTVVDGQAILGEWLQLQSTVQHTLGSFSIMACYGNPTRAPKSFVLAGSNEGSVWVSLQTVADLTAWTANLQRTFTVPAAQAFSFFRLIVTNTTGRSETYLTIDKLTLYDAQVTACTGTCAAGTTKFCSPDGATTHCCTPSQYFISGTSTACVTCPANSAPDTVYQERCVANAGFYGPSLYMFDGSTPSYRNLGSRTSHVVSPVGWRPTFGTVATRFGAYFDSSVNGNYYVVSNDYNTMTIAFWMYLIGPYDAGTVARFAPMSMRSNQALADPRGFNLDLGRTAAGTGVGVFYLYYGTQALYGMTAADVFPLTQWLHVALVVPSGSPSTRIQKMFVNGVLRATRTADSPSQDLLNFQLLLLAANVLDSRYYKGYLQQLTMYNYAMTDAEVSTLYNAGTPLVFTACTGTCTNTGWIKHCTAQGSMVCCPPGTFFRPETDTACQSCPAGTYSGTSASACTLCPAGTFSLGVNQVLASACTACPANSQPFANRSGCAANTGYYNLEENLLAYYPFRPTNVYQDASNNGYALTNANGASYAPQSECTTSPFPGAGVAFFNNPGVSFAGAAVTTETGSPVQGFRATVGTGWNLYPVIGLAAAPGPGFSWCYWLRVADGATAGTVNSIPYPFAFMIGNIFASHGTSGFHGMYDGRDTGSTAKINAGNSGTNYYRGASSSGGVGITGIYTRNWIHVCYTWQGTSFKVYLNCISSTCIATQSATLTAEAFNGVYTQVLIGQGTTSNALFGWLSDFRFYKKALTPAEVFAVRSYAGTTAFSVSSGDFLLAYYPFNPSNIYADASGNGYTLTSTNGANFAPTYDATTAPFPGAGVVFMNNPNIAATAGTAQTFRITAGSGFDLRAMIGTSAAPGEGFSVCFWYRVQSNTIAYVNGFSLGYTTSGANYIRWIRDASSTGIGWGVVSGGSNNGIGNHLGSGQYASTWTHTCLTMSGRNWLAYYNCDSPTCIGGSLAATNDVANIMYNLVYIGQNQWDWAWYGWFSEVRLYKKALSPAEVYAVRTYTGATPVFSVNTDPSLLAYYPFKQADIYADASGNGYTLANTNAGNSPTYDATTSPFPGAGVVYMNNNNVAATAGTAKTFKIQAGSGFDLRGMIGTSVSPGFGFSLCYWYRVQDGVAGTVNTIAYMNGFSFGNTGSSTTFIRWIRNNQIADIIWAVNSGGTIIGQNTGTGMVSRYWTHVCLTFAGRSWNNYYNCSTPTCTPGVLTTSTDIPNILYKDVYIGQHQSDPVWYGWFSEVRLYKKALSAAEVFAVRSYGSTTPAIYGNNFALLAYYPFNQGNIYLDASGNGYDLGDANTGGGYSPTFGGGTTAPFPGAGVAYFNNAGTNYAGATVTTETGSPVQGFRVNVGTGWNLYPYIGLAATPGPGFSWCYWLRVADGATAGTVNSIPYPFVMMVGNAFLTTGTAGFYGWYDGRDTGSASKISNGNSGTNQFRGSGNGGGGLAITGIYTRNWVHVCFTWQGASFQVFLNCASSTCTATQAVTLTTEAYNGLYMQVLIGQGTYSNGLYGWLSEFRFYKKALTPAEVFAIRSFDGTNPTAVNSVNNGLLAYYPFHPNAFLVDASGVTGTLTNTGSVVSQAASLTDLQNVAYFAQPGGLGNGNAQRQFFTLPQLTIGPASSMCIWYNPDSTSGSYPRLVSLNSGQNTGQIDIRRDASSTSLAFEVFNGINSIVSQTGCTASAAGAQGGCAYSGTFQTGVWQHVCLVLSDLAGRVYYNGVLQSPIFTLTARKQLTTYTTAWIGMNTYSNDLYRGQLDELRIYSRAISAAEVASIYSFRGDTYTPSIVLKCDTSACAAGRTGYCLPSGTLLCCGPNQFFRPGVDTACQQCPLSTFSPDGGLTACRACSTLPYWSTSALVTTLDVAGYRVFAFSAFSYPGFLFRHDTSVDVLLVGGGGGGGAQISGGGGAGAVLYFPGAVFTAQTTYSIVHGVGGGKASSAGTVPGNSGTAAYIRNSDISQDLFRASGGGGAGTWYTNQAVSGGSGGGGGACDLTNCASKTSGSATAVNVVNGVTTVGPGSAGVSRFVLGNGGGFGTLMNPGSDAVNNGIHGGGGGGAGARGGDELLWNSNCASGQQASCGRCGYGGNGVAGVTLDGIFHNFTTIFGSAYTTRSQSGFVGGGGGGGGFSTYGLIKCNGGLGGGGAGYKTNTAGYPGEDGVLGTGGGGGGSNDNQNVGGNGGRGMILIRAPAVCVCPAGTYSNVDGCADCPAGTFTTSVGLLSSAGCTLCGAGTYSTGALCIACSAGTFSTALGATLASTCATCSAGTYSTGSGLSAGCLLCGAGTYSTGLGSTVASACLACSAGMYSSASGATIASTCASCLAGTFTSITGQTVCGGCAAGTFASGTGLSVCSSCLAGSISGGGTSTCSLCTQAKYVATAGASTCLSTTCAAGSFSSGLGLTSAVCTACGAGTYRPLPAEMPWAPTGWTSSTDAFGGTDCSSSVYIQMANGQPAFQCGNWGYVWWYWYVWDGGYSSSMIGGNVYHFLGPSNIPACTNVCHQGQYEVMEVLMPKLTGMTYCLACQVCAAGTFLSTACSSTQNGVCTACPAGTYGASAGLSVCTPCPAGTYSAATSASQLSACLACSAGTYSATTSASVSSVCLSCSVGTFNSGTGGSSAAACGSCSAGTYSGNTGASLASACTSCVAGTYSSALAATAIAICTACGTGTYSTGLAMTSVATCTSCSAGTYSGNTGASLASACVSCVAGRYSSALAATAIAICTACGTGTYSTGLAMTSIATCTACIAGTFSASTGASLASACTACPAGGYSGAAGVSVCVLCGAGTYSTVLGASLIATCQGCFAGAYSTAQGLPASASCIRCGAGTYSTGTGMATAGACQSCAAGAYSSGTGIQAACTLCGAGTYSTSLAAIAVGTCQLCLAGTYSSALGLPAVCTACGAGTYSTTLGATIVSTCLSCQAGTYWTGTGQAASCTLCAAGTYSTVLGAVSIATCSACNSGTYSTVLGGPAVSVCQSCIAGTFQTGTGIPASASCSQCGAGRYSTNIGAIAATTCQLCLAGTYSSALGLPNACPACGAGTYSTTLGATIVSTCLTCSSGTYYTGTGAALLATCTSCSAGTYGTGTGATIASVCLSCSAGTYYTGTGAALLSTCTSCLAGTYGTGTGATMPSVCLSCPAGRYYTGTGATLLSTCDSCLSGFYATGTGATASSACLFCLPGTYNPIWAQTVCLQCPAGSHLTGFGFRSQAWCDYCTAGTYSTSSGATNSGTCQGCLPGSFSTGEGMPSSSTCSSCLQGLFTSSSAAASCQSCGAGSFSSSVQVSACQSCSAGTYASGLQTTACQACESGRYASRTGSSACVTCDLCPSGFIVNTDCIATWNITCSACLPGTVSAGAYASACTSCAPGTYVELAGQAGCNACGPGTFSMASGAASSGTCTLCIPGTYGAGLASTACNACEQGKYFSSSGGTTTFTIAYGQGSAIFIPGTSPCIACAAGTFAKEVQASACAECAGGTYASSAGHTACAACDIGTYTNATGLASCLPCPANSNTSGTNSTRRGDCVCLAGYVGNLSNSAQTCISCPANSYCAGLSQQACPANTRSPALSSLQAQCRCVAGYRCTYTRNVALHVDYPSSLDYTAQAGAIQSTLAAAAGVPPGSVAWTAGRIYIIAPPPGPPPSAEF